tara:strand:+ start:239 stop:484 length:246 start_codon:yes stop_codon:yes gene_type:complete
MKKTGNVIVKAKDCRNNPHIMIRRFMKKVKKERIIEEIKDRRYYKKPSEAKKEKSIRAQRQRARDERKKLRAKERRNRNNK